MMEYDIHTILDMLTLTATGWVLFTMLTNGQVKQTYQADMDKIKWYFVVSTIREALRAQQCSCSGHIIQQMALPPSVMYAAWSDWVHAAMKPEVWLAESPAAASVPVAAITTHSEMAVLHHVTVTV